MTSRTNHWKQLMNTIPKTEKSAKGPRHAWKKGMIPTPNMVLSANISWVMFQLRSASGNIPAAVNRVLYNKEALAEYSSEGRHTLESMLARADQLALAARNLAEEIANFNKNKSAYKLED